MISTLGSIDTAPAQQHIERLDQLGRQLSDFIEANR